MTRSGIPRTHVDAPTLDTLKDGTLVLPDDAAHRFTRVLRLHDGDAVEVFDGHHRVARGRLRGATLVDVTIVEVADALPPLVVAQAMTKTDKLELVVKKGTELGASRFVLVDTARAQVHVDGDRADKKVERLARIAEDAARQSLRATVPAIAGPVAMKALVDEVRAFAGVCAVGVVGAAGPLSDVLAAERDRVGRDGLLIVVGPEGGLDDAEVRALTDAGAHAVRLGAHVLRTETAALVALSAAQVALGLL